MNRKSMGILAALAVVILLMGYGAGFITVYSLERARATPGLAALPTVEPEEILVESVPVAQPLSDVVPHFLPVVPGDLGPRLLETGAIDLPRFVALYERSGRPLTPEQRTFLETGSEEALVISWDNANFLLNFFWAVGLTNRNPLLTDGPLMKYAAGQIGRYASTGGWTIGVREVTELYASAALLPLTAEQQARLEEVAATVYRPCCDNHTAFPDCNHGMAMLGLLTLLASQDAGMSEMYTAARAANTVWFPAQSYAIDLYFRHVLNLDFAGVEARLTVGPEVASSAGFQQLHAWLAAGNLLEQVPGGGSGCGL